MLTSNYNYYLTNAYDFEFGISSIKGLVAKKSFLIFFIYDQSELIFFREIKSYFISAQGKGGLSGSSLKN